MRKADNLNTILCRCHEIWEPKLPGTLWGTIRPVTGLIYLFTGTKFSYQDELTPGPVTAFGPDTYPSCLHLTSNQQQLQNQTAYVVTNAIVVTS